MHKIARILAVAALLFFSATSYAEWFETKGDEEWRVNYRGTLKGSVPVGMTLIFEGGNLSGTYFYEKSPNDMTLRGRFVGDREFVLEELSPKGKVAGIFRGTFPEKDPGGRFETAELQYEVMTGTWTSADGKKSYPFYLYFDNVTSNAKGAGRYSNAGVKDDAALEKAVQKFKKAVVERKKKLVVTMLAFPLEVSIDGKDTTLKTADEFLANYDKIFHDGVYEKIKQSVPHNMFVRHDGIMLGEGEVWFGSDGRVTAINN